LGDSHKRVSFFSTGGVMNRTKISFIISTLILSAALAGCSGLQNKPLAELPKLPDLRYEELVPKKTEGGNYTFQGKWPRFPDRLTVYRWQRDPETRKVEELKLRLGMARPLAKETPAGFPGEVWLDKDGKRLFLEDNGGFHFVRSTVTVNNHERTPAGQEAILKARDVLREMKLWPGTKTRPEVQPSFIQTVFFNGRLSAKTVNREVIFHRQLGGVADLASRLRVTIGPGGRLVEIERNWPTLQAVGSYPLITPQEALAKLRKERSLFPGAPRGDVSDLKLAYYTLFDQPYLVPVYVFRYQKGKERNLNMVMAVKDIYLRK